ncbi:MAG: peptidoglycan-associated lipoprotein Pal [Vicinamibacterales bacterium]
MLQKTQKTLIAGITLGLIVTGAACAKKAPITPPPVDPFPQGQPTTPAQTPAETPPRPPDIVPPEPAMTGSDLSADPYASFTVDEINDPATSPLKPAFFAYDSDVLDDPARQVLDQDAQVLKDHPTWIITIEGHCDERGTSEYNLALGDRRALAAKNYLQSLGIAANRLNTVSYGKEFPFDPGHTEAAYVMNRRAHFMVTAK